MDDLNAFATDGYRLMDSLTSDLNDDGRPDALLVLDPPADGDKKLGQGTPRRVLIVVRGESGQLHEAARNDKIVPCSACGGLAGDPYAFTRVERGQFTISNGGGSRERWSDDYTFTYSTERKDWLLSKVTRSVSDEETNAHKAIELTPKDFGDITFKDFDPGKLPKVELP
ncbi:hypothetical protein SAMN04487785_101225 [Dyella jiangningensis]|nr:hypothetical protein [Dyella sp. AtDHG13]PXV59804.1 hypothetical protein BDW41_103346 [Dyella sp. AtDHG13]SDJ21962.1 hypothetical protein SAMN04487785_101225 [Dyella jiangningensis]